MSFSVIIPSKTGSNLLVCVQAIRHNEPGVPIVVVDDGVDFSFNTRPVIHEEVQLITGAKPFIFSRNINLGIQRAIEINSSVEGFVLTNDDALLMSPGGFSRMAKSAKDNPEFGIIGATCNNVGNPNQFPRQGGGIYGAGLRGGALEGLREEPRMVCFVCVYIPRTTIERVGYLDERYTGYGMDDDDYCFEVRKAGLKIGIHDGCFVDHGSLKSSFRGDPSTPADFNPNLELFKQKWGTDNWGRPA